MSRPRIIAGSAKGRYLETPKAGTRPSPSRLRESLFNIIQFEERLRFLDLFSGSGAVALEAASRGWQSSAVDLSKEAAAVIGRNAKSLGLGVNIFQTDAIRFAQNNPHSFEIVFAAPPYPLDLQKIFQDIISSHVATPTGLYIFQYPSNFTLTLEDSAKVLNLDERRYGSNVIAFIRPHEAAAL